MTSPSFEIRPYTASDRPQVLEVWEDSVLATHTFLSVADFKAIRQLVAEIDFGVLAVFCLTKGPLVLGFIGLENRKIEMLFLRSSCFGQGLGQRLLQFAVLELNANELDVNEQNVRAVQFYWKAGFVVVERTDLDGQGRQYPLLKMKRPEHPDHAKQ